MEDSAEIAGSRRWLWFAVALAVVAAVAAWWINRHVFPYYSGDHDEPVYRYQAAMLLDGRLTIPTAQWAFFRPWLSGPADSHLVMAFQPLWPAVLAVAHALVGTTRAALILAAGIGALAVYLLAAEMLRSRALAALAALLFAVSPFPLLLNGTYLNYGFSAALGTLLAWTTLRATTRDSVAWGGAAGALFGAILLLRPFDAALFALPLVGYALTRRRGFRIRRLAFAAACAALPFVVGMLAYNLTVTGSPLTFPTSAQSQGWAAFGWGDRALSPEFDPVHFTFVKALRSLGRNAAALPTWMFGSYLGLVGAGFGWQALRRRDPGRAGLLLAMTLAFPLGYLAWWASSLTSSGAFTGLGPHYYLPSLVPLSILLAAGLGRLPRQLAPHRRRAGAIATALVLLAATVAFSVPKAREQLRYRDAVGRFDEAVNTAVARLPDRPLVILDRQVHPYVMGEHATLDNPPDLDARVLYAIDRGIAAVNLLRSTRRPTYRIERVLRPGDELGGVRPRIVRQNLIAKDVLTIRTRIVNTSVRHVVTAYARLGDRRVAVVLDRHSARGATYRVTWQIDADGVRLDAESEVLSETRYPVVRGPRLEKTPPAGRAPAFGLVIGTSFENHVGQRDPDRVERRYYARTRRGRVEMLSAPEHWTRLGAPLSGWLPLLDTTALTVRIVA